MLYTQRSLCWLLLVVFSSLWPGSASVPLRNDAEEVNRETMALMQQIQEARRVERLKEQLPVDDRRCSQVSGDDKIGMEFGENVLHKEESLEEGDGDYLDYIEDDHQITQILKQNVKDTEKSDHLVQELVSESDSKKYAGSNSDTDKSNKGALANVIDKVTRTPGIQDKTDDDKVKSAMGNGGASSKHIEYDGKRRIIDGIMSDIDDLIRHLHAYENISRSEQEHALKLATMNDDDDDEPGRQRNNSKIILANVRRALEVVRQSTDGNPSATPADRDHCEAVLGVRETRPNSANRDQRLRDDHTRIAALEEAFHVKLVDNDVYHFERIEPGIEVTFRGKHLTKPMIVDEVLAMEGVIEPYLRGRTLMEAMLVWTKMTKLKVMLHEALHGTMKTPKTTYVVEDDEQFEEDIVLTPEHALEIWDETVISIRSGDLLRSYVKSKKMERTLRKSKMLHAGDNNVTKRENKDQVLELLTKLRQLLETRQRQRRSADYRGTSTPMAEIVRCLLQLLNRHEHEQKATVTKRNMEADNLWELPIKYEMSENMTVAEKEMILEALTHWETFTCIRFTEEKSLNYTPGLIFKTEDLQLTCGSSLVGKQPRGNVINIAPRCFDQRTIVHEVGHSLGLWHEHSRPDRDDYVQVMWDNIEDDKKTNFMKKSWKNTVVRGVGYDLDSIMHYPSWAMASYSEPSLVPYDTAMLAVMGRGNKLSFGDAALVNFHYCNSVCNTRELRWKLCQHGGYRDPNDCQRCRCIDGWEGDERCSKVHTNITVCGKSNLIATEKPQILHSPGYTNDQNPYFRMGDNCAWLITSPVGTHIKVRFVDVFAMRCSLGCDNDWVEVRGKRVDRPGPRFCCNRPYMLLTSAGNQMMILFRSHIENYIESQGFKLEYSISVPACGICDNAASPAPACSREISYRCKMTYTAPCFPGGERNCTRYRWNTCYKTKKYCCRGRLKSGGMCVVKTCGGCKNKEIKVQRACRKMKVKTKLMSHPCNETGSNVCHRIGKFRSFVKYKCCHGYRFKKNASAYCVKDESEEDYNY